MLTSAATLGLLVLAPATVDAQAVVPPTATLTVSPSSIDVGGSFTATADFTVPVPQPGFFPIAVLLTLSGTGGAVTIGTPTIETLSGPELVNCAFSFPARDYRCEMANLDAPGRYRFTATATASAVPRPGTVSVTAVVVGAGANANENLASAQPVQVAISQPAPTTTTPPTTTPPPPTTTPTSVVPTTAVAPTTAAPGAGSTSPALPATGSGWELAQVVVAGVMVALGVAAMAAARLRRA